MRSNGGGAQYIHPYTGGEDGFIRSAQALGTDMGRDGLVIREILNADEKRTSSFDILFCYAGDV